MRAELTGDEPQIFVRAGVAPVGIGADRYQTGLLLEKQFGVDVVLLDDGFQHVRLQRRADVVLIDALRPFGGCRLFPLGRLREPEAGLGRADVFLITRSDWSDLVPAIEKTIRRWNERAPVFHAAVRPTAWVEHATGERFEIGAAPFRRAAGFCGLGNTESFRRSLGALGIDLAEWVEFDDHHRYRPYQLRRLAQLGRAGGATALVTTEKDAINLIDDSHHLIDPLRLFWLQVELRIDDEAGFLDAIAARI
jgi:tetraacyldisaccharide 4'-kinase